MKSLLFVVLAIALARPAQSQIKTEIVEYKDGETVLQGYLSYDASVKGSRPAIVVAHDWFGVSDYTKMRAEQLAALGYVAFTADIYGKGIRPATAKEAGTEAGKYYGNRQLMRQRMQRAYNLLAARPEADSSRMAVMGYCFGGACALELARNGASLKGIVTFHGSLNTPNPQDAKNIKGKVLVLHGADDPYVKEAEVASFMQEMRAAGVDYQLVQYGGAVHSFTDKRAGKDNSVGAAYNKAADQRSWRAMKTFFKEVFGK